MSAPDAPKGPLQRTKVQLFDPGSSKKSTGPVVRTCPEDMWLTTSKIGIYRCTTTQTETKRDVSVKWRNVICQKRLKRLLAETALMDTARDHGPASRR